MADENENKAWEYPESHAPPNPPPQPPAARETPAFQEPAAQGNPAPRSRVADELLLLFGRLAAAILFAVVLLTGLMALFQPEKDLAGVYSLLNTQLSLIIGAVLGYAAHPTEKER
jgi:hypothetical protein